MTDESTSDRQPGRHAVLVSFGSHGDLHPFLGIGLALLRRGWQVTLIANARYERETTDHGFDFKAVGSVDDFNRFTGSPDMWDSKKAVKLVFGAMSELAQPTHEALQELAPDVVIASTLAAGARVFRETHPAVPLVTVHLQPTALRSNIDPPHLPGLPPLHKLPLWLKKILLPHFWNGADRYVLDPMVKQLADYRATLGLEATTSYLGNWQHSPDRVLAMWPDWYAPPPADWPEQARLPGFPLYDERETTSLPPEVAAFLDEGEPPVAFTPGSAMFFGETFFAAAADACQRLGRRGLLLSRHAAHLPRDLPADVLHVPFAPFSALLPRCCAVVHHGGVGTLSQGLAAGLPQVIMPMAHDQPDNARRVLELGVGDAIAPRRFTGRRVAKVLARLLGDPKVADACRRFATRVAETDGLAAAADDIEALHVATA